MTSDEKSFIEKREHERVVTKVEVGFKVIEENQALEILNGDSFQDVLVSEQYHMPGADMDEIKTVTEDISVTGLGLLGDIEMFGGKAVSTGNYLLLSLKVEGSPPVRTVARVVWAAPVNGVGQFRTGLFFEGISKEDVARLADQVRASKEN